jgi:hypothetical protein
MKINNILNLVYKSARDIVAIDNPIGSTASHLERTMAWLCLAQDSTADGGVSEGRHLYHGWLPSYPETTGYIIETFLKYFHRSRDVRYRERALRMADWLLSIQNVDGSIPDSYFRKKMVFDTGQVIYGFVSAFEETGDLKYKQAAEKAGHWLLGIQETDGSWITCAVDEIPHTYYSRVAWGLLKIHRITADDEYRDGCLRNIDWCIRQQQANGWFDNASFNLINHPRPFTHTIAYTIDGILESGLSLNEEKYVASAQKALDSILLKLPQDGRVYGTYDKNWDGDDTFSCLTGNAQLAINFFRLYEYTRNLKYKETALKINHYLKGKQGQEGSLAGSYPIWGKYIHFTYPNWAAKFFADSLLLEEQLTKKTDE